MKMQLHEKYKYSISKDINTLCILNIILISIFVIATLTQISLVSFLKYLDLRPQMQFWKKPWSFFFHFANPLYILGSSSLRSCILFSWLQICIFNIIFTLFTGVPLSTLIPLFCLHLIAASSSVTLIYSAVVYCNILNFLTVTPTL